MAMAARLLGCVFAVAAALAGVATVQASVAAGDLGDGAFPQAPAAAADDPLVVQTTMGSVRGVWGPWPEKSVRMWKGMPYATPPVGSRRFLPPTPYSTPWSGVRDASQFGDDCPQHKNGMSDRPQSEDCLFVNVFSPADAPAGADLPVMVFLYGGSWVLGSDSFPIYNGEALIHHNEKRVVVVTLNYRLGALGFLGNSKLGSLNAGGTTGNMGIQDQREALRWVQANIGAFGGDPNTVLLFGESAGAGSTTTHLFLERSKGLFHRALMESGPVAHWTAKPLKLAELQAARVAADVGCDVEKLPARELLECLQRAPVDKLLDADAHVPGYLVDWSPCIDGVELKEEPWVLAARGEFASHVPLLLGTNLNEGSTFVRHLTGGHAANASSYRAWIGDHFTNETLAELIYKRYPPSDFPSPWWAASRVLTDAEMGCPARRTADLYQKALNLHHHRRQSRRGQTAAAPAKNNVFLYHFTHEWDVLKLDPSAHLGVFHGSELLGVWSVRTYPVDGIYVPVPLTPDEYQLQDRFGTWWTNFAATGNPNTAGNNTAAAAAAAAPPAAPARRLPAWPTFNGATTAADLQIDLEPSTNEHRNRQNCAFWDDNWPVYKK